jgi:hypothetical protein
MRHDDAGCLGGGDAGIQGPDDPHGQDAADDLDEGAIPAKVSENIRPTAIAGLAKLVEEVKKYAAPIYAPTAAGAARLRPDRASAKITRMSPRVATISDRKCAGEARSLAEMLTAARENIRFATTAPPMQPATWAGR